MSRKFKEDFEAIFLFTMVSRLGKTPTDSEIPTYFEKIAKTEIQKIDTNLRSMRKKSKDVVNDKKMQKIHRK